MRTFLTVMGVVVLSGISIWAMIMLAKESAREKAKRLDLEDRLRRAGTLARHMAKRLPSPGEFDNWLRRDDERLPDDSTPGGGDDRGDRTDS